MDLEVSQKHRVLQITLTRPEKRNALTIGMSEKIAEAILNAQGREDIGCVTISATGSVFCSGMDLDEASESEPDEITAAHEALFTIGARSIKPIVVAVNGAALGGGLGLVAQGHVVIAAEGAVFGLPEIRIGLWPFFVYRSISNALGPRRALDLSLTGESFSAAQACQWGLVHRVCPCPEVGDRAKAIARNLAKASPLAIQAGMRFVRDSTGMPPKQAGDLAATARKELMASSDFREGRISFKQKREPHWPSMPPGFYAEKTPLPTP